MIPPFLGTVVEEPPSSVEVGARTTLRVRLVPAPMRTWVMECTDSSPTESFVDVQTRGPMGQWSHTHLFDALEGATRLTDSMDFTLPLHVRGPLRARVLQEMDRVFTHRHEVLREDLAFRAAHPSPPLRVAISGSTGLIGSHLSALLSVTGHEVVPIVRESAPVRGAVAMDADAGWVDMAALEGVDAVVHLAGAPIAGRFTERHKKEIRESRVGPTRLLADAAARAGVRTLVSASAIGYYGANPGGEVTETSPAGDDFLARVVHDWEAATRPAAEAGLRTVQVRTGIVLTPEGGALPLQLPLFRAFVGGPLARGTAWQSWISIDDAVGAFAHAVLRDGLTGPVNAVAPTPVTTAEFASDLGDVLSRPSLMGVPRFGPELLLGKEGAELMAHASQRVRADALEASGYRFRHRTLDRALRHVLGV